MLHYESWEETPLEHEDIFGESPNVSDIHIILEAFERGELSPYYKKSRDKFFKLLEEV
jgi:hypothetical protein